MESNITTESPIPSGTPNAIPTANTMVNAQGPSQTAEVEPGIPDLKQCEALFELGKLYCDRGDFVVALGKLKDAAKGYFAAREFEKYLKCKNLLLRMYAEREEFHHINEIKEKLQDLVLREGFELSAKTYYTLALCTSYKGQYQTALEYLQKALAIALANDSKEDICYSISGLAIVYAHLDRLSDALKEIYNLQVFFQVIDMPEVRIASQIWNAYIQTRMQNYDQALEILWRSYDMLKETKNLTTYVQVLFNMGYVYQQSGDKDLAKMYLHLALKSVDPINMRHLHRSIRTILDELGGESQQIYDLIYDAQANSVFEKKLGKIDFRNQFILLDLLRLFLQHPGKIYSKEYLVEFVWKQKYDPSVHDNKIYVTIKRLRKIIEPDIEKPKYIFRAKNGYYLNKTARVLLNH